MRSVPVILSLLLFSMLSAQQRKPQGFSNCDKTAQTQADLTQCAGDELKSADDELNRTYQELLKRAAGNRIAVQKIKVAQRAWVAFRDAQIAALYPAEDKQREYGTVFPMCEDLALTDLTRERTRMLKAMLNIVEGDVCASDVTR